MSGLATIVMASSNENAKGANSTDKRVIDNLSIVVENGLLTRYHLLEDSFEVSEKAKL